MKPFRGFSPLDPFIRLASALTTILMFGGGLLTLTAQSAGDMPTAGATFRAGAREVLVDAVVTDKKGNFRRDLTQQDFSILEDSREQKITSFAVESTGVPGHSGKRFIALVFDSERPGLREEVTQFVDRSSGPELYITVFSRVDDKMRLQQAFTSDAGRIKTALLKMQVSTAPPLERALPSPAHNPLTDRVSSVVTDLAQIRGRKALILFSGSWSHHREAGVPPNPNDPWLKTIHDCNAAGVSVYSFITSDTRGGGPGDSPAAPGNGISNHATDTDLIYELVAGTGGRYTPTGTYDMAAYLRKASAEQSDYYLLGYVPTGDSADKPCHKLRVKVNIRGVDVKSRDSYCLSGESAAARITQAQRGLEVQAASGAKGSVAVGLQLSWFRSLAQMAAVEIDMDIDPAAMKMRGPLHGEIDVSGTVQREDGSIAARFEDTVEKHFDSQAQLGAFLKAPYHYAKQLRITPGRYNVRVAGGSADRAFGVAEKLLDIDPWSSQALSVSGIALGITDYPETTAAAELDDSLLQSTIPHSLAALGRVLRPLGGAQFAAGQNGLFYFEVYDFRSGQLGAARSLDGPPPALQFRILDRERGDVKIDSGPLDAGEWRGPGNPVIRIAPALPLSGLPPGAYTLEVRVTRDNGEGAVTRHVDFDVR